MIGICHIARPFFHLFFHLGGSRYMGVVNVPFWDLFHITFKEYVGIYIPNSYG